MSITARRVLAFFGAIVLGLVVGGGFDAADVTPNYDGDMSLRGLIGGASLGLIVAAIVRE